MPPFRVYPPGPDAVKSHNARSGCSGVPQRDIPLGGGRIPADSSLQLGSDWNLDPRRPVATPQTNDPSPVDPVNMTRHPANADYRLFLPHVQALKYPTDLEVDTTIHSDCDIPIKRLALPNPSWHQLFGPGSTTGDLWAWWGQQVSEVRQQVTPAPIG